MKAEQMRDINKTGEQNPPYYPVSFYVKFKHPAMQLSLVKLQKPKLKGTVKNTNRLGRNFYIQFIKNQACHL